MENHAEAYREEAAELLAGLEDSLLELEQSPGEMSVVGAIFRALHTVKGSGAMFGFDRVAAFTHEIESAFDLVRDGRLAVTPELINIGLAARDHIRGLLAERGTPLASLNERGAVILADLTKLRGVEQTAPGGKTVAETKTPVRTSETFRVRFTPSPDCLMNGANPLLLLNELRELGDTTVTARTGAIPHLREIDPERSYLGWDAAITTDKGEEAIRDVFIFVDGDSEVMVQLADASPEQPPKRIGEILVERGDATVQAVEAVLETRPKIGDCLVQNSVVDAEQVQSALAEQELVKKSRENREQAETVQSVRVPAAKLDGLVNIVGELVTVQARLTQLAGVNGDPDLMFVAEEVERLTEKLRDTSMSIRMLPIGGMFSRFRRLVRDLSRTLGKDVDLVMDGGETEIDKTVIERLADPLVHIIRNSMDHGVEAPAARVEAGKPARGRIHLSAAHAGASVAIRISDDGAGLDVDAIRKRAVERGLMAPDAVLTDQEVYSFILKPGFSTARELTGVSGRGVGMDVVKSSVEALRGSLEIQSVRGKGTTITLRLPLTLAIIDGLLVQVADSLFVLPLSNILECIEVASSELGLSGGRRIVSVRDELVGCIRLRELFGVGGKPPALEQVVIAETSHGKYGLVVDVVVGDHQTVIKPLSRIYRDVKAISGATIMGDGSVALIVDVDKLAASALHDEESARRIPCTVQ